MKKWGGGSGEKQFYVCLLCLNMKFETGTSQTRLDGWAQRAWYALLRSLYVRVCEGNYRGFKQKNDGAWFSS